MPTALFCSEYHDPEAWAPLLKQHVPGLDLRVWPEAGDEADIDILLTWTPPPDWQRRFPRLRLIHLLAAGVDHLVGQPFPDGVLLARVSEARQISGLCDYVLGGVLHFHREMHRYRDDQARKVWRPRTPVEPRQRVVGIMGLGTFGAVCAGRIAGSGFATRGWSRTAKEIEGVETFHGEDGLKAFLNGCDIVVCMLPLTPQTKGILDRRLFAMLPRDACIINVGRGGHCVDADLVAALEQGRLGGALIDVTEPEPLPPDHPFWTAPNLILTPHIGTRVNTENAVRDVAENILRLGRGETLHNLVDRARGY